MSSQSQACAADLFTIDLSREPSGTRFRQRNGIILTLLGPNNPGAAAQFKLTADNAPGQTVLRYSDGSFSSGVADPTELDIVVKLPPHQQVTAAASATGDVRLDTIPIGTMLVTRGGSRVRLTSKITPGTPYHAGTVTGQYPFRAGKNTYTADGKYLNNGSPHEKDVVAVEPPSKRKGLTFEETIGALEAIGSRLTLDKRTQVRALTKFLVAERKLFLVDACCAAVQVKDPEVKVETKTTK